MRSERLKTNAEQQAKQETRDHETRKLKKEQARLVAAHEQQMERMLLAMRTLQAECSATEARAARAALYNSPG